MPLLRFERWKFCTPLAPHVAYCTRTGHRYLWDGSHDGAVLVPDLKDVKELLNPSGDQASLFDVAWDQYGVLFDTNGQERPTPPPTITITEPVISAPTEVRRGPGRPKKFS